MVSYQILYQTIGLFLLLSVSFAECTKILYQTIGLFLLLSVSFVECTKVHELMTDDEIMNIFQTTRDQVPEYRMVAIEHSLRKRSIPQDFIIKFKAFDNDVQAYLDPIDGILVGEDTPVWVAHTRRGKTHYQMCKRGIMKEVLGFYQGVSDEAALVVRSRNSRDLQFFGTIRNLTVMPLPDRVQQELEATEESKRDLSEISRVPTISKYHIVFKLNRTVNQTPAVQKANDKNSDDTFKQNNPNKSKRSNKHIVFPTILVTTDFDVAVNPREDHAYYDQIIYQLAFWNAVDLRYRHLNNPKVRLRIAGLVIGYGRSATPYLERNTNNQEADCDVAIGDMQDYWGKMRWDYRFAPGGFHIVATATNLKLFYESESGTKRWLEGVASTASICTENENGFYPSMIFADNLGFGGINVAVHELAHVLGANHDDQEECPSSAGYIMADSLSTTVNNLKWSKCSANTIGWVLRARNCTDEPKEHYPSGKPLKRVLPGALKTTDEQCQARGYDWACEPTPGMCRGLRCYFSGIYSFFTTLLQCYHSWSAAEGTECAPGSYCIDGECLLVHSEVLQPNEQRVLLSLVEEVLSGPR